MVYEKQYNFQDLTCPLRTITKFKLSDDPYPGMKRGKIIINLFPSMLYFISTIPRKIYFLFRLLSQQH